MNLKKITAAMTALSMLCGFSVLPASAEGETTESTVLTETESNDTIAAANELAVNTAIQGNNSTGDDKDYYKVVLEEDGKIDINFTITESVTTSTSRTYWNVAVYDENGSIAKSHSINGAQIIYNLDSMGLDAGTYYIAVTAGSNYSSDQLYTMTIKYDTVTEWESENNGTLTNADTLTANTPIGGNSYVKEDADYYKLTLTEDAALDVSFAITELLSSSNTYWKITLYAGEGAEETIHSIDISGNALNHKMNTVGLSAGTYYIKVLADDYYYSNTSYTLTAKTTTGLSIESEDNDSIPNADAMTLDTAFTANIQNSSDMDYFAVELTDHTAVTLKFGIADPISTSTSEKYWTVSLIDVNSTVLLSYHIYGNTTSFALPTIGLDADTYYVQVKPYSSYYWSNVAYTLTVSSDTETPWEGEDNDTMANADTLTLGTGMNGLLHLSDDVDYYKFTLTEQSGVSFSLDPSVIVTDSTSKTYWNVTICGEDGNAVASYGITANTIKNNFTILGLDAGTYYVRVQEDYYYTSTQYLLTAALVDELWEGESNNTLSTADDLSPNTPINGRIHASDGMDYYKVSFDKAGMLNVSFVIEPDSSNTSEYWQLTLMDENGNSLQTQSVSGENATVMMPEYEVGAGTYYIQVANDSYYYWTTQYTLTANYEESTAVLGDVNEDGLVDASDAAAILVAAAKLGSGAESGLTDTQAAAADVNGDGAIDAMDAATILSYAAAVGSGNADAKLEDFI